MPGASTDEGTVQSPAEGELQGDAVLVPDEADASTLRNKGYFGETRPGGGLRLSPLEFCYLAEGGRLVVRRRGKEVSLPELFRVAGRAQPHFEIAYVVFRDLRLRGYVAEEGTPPVDFRLHPRGGGPGKTATRTWVAAVGERTPFDLSELLEQARHVKGVRRKLLVGVVDEESDLTYYAIREVNPKGRVRIGESTATARLNGDRATVPDADEADGLAAHAFGKRVGKRLQLSLLETVYLLDRKRLRVESPAGRSLGVTAVRRRAREMQPDFALRLRVYRDLRERGIVVKTGFKYGTHFRAYEGDPDRGHAKWLVHALRHEHRGGWPEISRAVRLAHGVRKQLLLASGGTSGVTYVQLERVRP